MVRNYLLYSLSGVKKRVLSRGLNYAMPTSKLNHGYYLTPFELIFHDIVSLQLVDNILDRLKVELKKGSYLLSYDKFWDKITKEKYNTVKNLSSNKEILIQKFDKVNSVVMLNRHGYITQMNGLLSGTSKFRNIDIKSGKERNMLQLEDRLARFVKSVKNSLSTNLYKELCPKCSQPGLIHGLARIHKPLVYNFPILDHSFSSK